MTAPPPRDGSRRWSAADRRTHDARPVARPMRQAVTSPPEATRPANLIVANQRVVRGHESPSSAAGCRAGRGDAGAVDPRVVAGVSGQPAHRRSPRARIGNRTRQGERDNPSGRRRSAGRADESGWGGARRRPGRAREPRAQKLALDEAMAGAGSRIMQGRIKDPKYPEDIWAKIEHVHHHPDGTATVVHY